MKHGSISESSERPVERASPRRPVLPFPVVGIGASAGGLQALGSFLDHTSPDSGMAFVVILHLAPEHASQAAAVLQAHTAMPVSQVTEATPLALNHVYVIPPARQLQIADGELRLVEPATEQERRAPIDHFFRTLADTHDRRAAAVILSGSGSDGVVGVKRIKEYGGVILVQDPQEAEFDGMPRSAIATGLVDYVVPVAAMPELLQAFWRRAGQIELPTMEGEATHDEAVLRELLALLWVRTNHDFSQYKRPTLLRRFGRRLQVTGAPDFAAYLQVLRSRPEEVQALLQDLLISVTNFFRDQDAWTRFQSVVPLLFARQVGTLSPGKGADDKVRVWVTACATGEEAYTVAMLLQEYADTLDQPPAIQVFATDIDDHAIGRARQGSYPETIAEDVSPARLARFFVREQGRYRVKQELREMVLFAHHNVLRDPPFGHLDLITCRNLLIYLNHEAQDQVVRLFHFCLQPGGYLLLGTAESLDGVSDHFDVVAGGQRLFRKRASSGLPLPLAPSGTGVPLSAPARGGASLGETRSGAVGELHQRLALTYGPPSLIVNSDYEIVHLSRGAGRFLLYDEGELSTNLLRSIHPDLRLDLRSALMEAAQQGTRAERPHVRVAFGDTTRLIDLVVQPIQDEEWLAGYLFVLLIDAGPTGETVASTLPFSDGLIGQLQAELEHTRSQLQWTIEGYETAGEEYKAANEELTATNEEMRAATEELETSQEELQAVNEELSTVNQELKHNVDELSQAHNDLQNLMSATQLPILFLDRELRLTRYTPSAEAFFNLIPTDLNRPFAHITHALHYNQLPADAAQVLATLQLIEREVASRTGVCYLVQLRPYRTTDDHIGGVVITFVDITARQRAEAALRASEERQAFLLTLSDMLRLLVDPIEIQEVAARMLGQHLGVSRIHYGEITADDRYVVIERDYTEGVASLTGRFPMENFGPASIAAFRAGRIVVIPNIAESPDVSAAERESYARFSAAAYVGVPLLKAGRVAAVFAVHQATSRAWAEAEIAQIQETAERTWAAVERARAAVALHESERRLRATQNTVGVGIQELDERGYYLGLNETFTRLSGYTLEDFAERTIFDDIPDERDREASRELYRRLVSGELGSFDEERLFVTKDGRHICIETLTTAVRDDDGRFLFAVCAIHDVTQRSDAEEALRWSEERLRLMIESAKDYAIFTTDLDRRVSSWNTGAQAMFGYSEREILGESGDILFTPDDRERGDPEREAKAAVTTERAENERWHVRKDGTRLFGSGVTMPLRDAAGNAIGMIKIMRDLTERQQAEEALRESEARFRAVADVVPDLLWSSDAGGAITWYNRRWYDYTGQTPEQALGAGWLEMIHPEDRERSQQIFEAAMLSGRPQRQEHRIRRADGAYHWFLSQAQPLRDERGSVVHWYGAWADVHEERMALTAAQEARAEAEAALQTRDQFLSIASHELRTPLTPLLGYAGMLRKGLLPGVEGSQRRLVETIERQAQRLNRLIGSLLDVSRLQRGQFALETQPLDLQALTAHLVDEFRLALPPAGPLTIMVETLDEPIPVLGDAARLEEVLQNLLSNAVKYSPGGGTIRVQVARQDGEAVLQVVDEGIGIPSESQPLLFEPFYRASNVGTQISGFGLGLYIVREIVQRHAGRVELESANGHGTTFRVLLPLADG